MPMLQCDMQRCCCRNALLGRFLPKLEPQRCGSFSFRGQAARTAAVGVSSIGKCSIAATSPAIAVASQISA